MDFIQNVKFLLPNLTLIPTGVKIAEDQSETKLNLFSCSSVDPKAPHEISPSTIQRVSHSKAKAQLISEI